MNSERRHELQENELASTLEKINQKIDPYSKPIAVVVAVAFVGMLAWGYYSTIQSEKRSDATYELMEGSLSGDSETLARVAATYPETPMAAWARLYQGSQQMGAGMNALFTSREEAEELLGEAKVAYEEALSLSQDTLIQSRAHFGLAKIAESLGKTDEAIASYEAVMEAGESDAMIAAAKEKIATLARPETQQFLTWFSQQDFSPADPGLPPSLPSDQMLPDMPDLNFPEVETSENESSAPVAPGPEEPAVEQPNKKTDANEKLAAQTPADDKADAEKAGKDKKPAMEKSEPVVEDESAAEEPKTEEPKSEQSKSKQSESEKPEAEKPEAMQPESEKPDAEKPEAEKPEAEKPDGEKPDGEKPDSETPESEKPAVEEKPAAEPESEPADASGEENGAASLSAPENS